MPAVGWNGVYIYNCSPYYKVEPLAAWGLVQETQGDMRIQVVRGIEAHDRCEIASDDEHFLLYVHDRDVNKEAREYWLELGKLEEHKRRKKKP